MARRLRLASLGAVTLLLLVSLVAQVASRSLRSPSASGRSMSVSKRIIGGYPVQKGDSPFLVSLQIVDVANRSAEHICGASVIMGRFLLTAAHCVERIDKNPEKLKAFLGTLRSGSRRTHDDHKHTEDTDDFRTNASVIIRKLLEGEKLLLADYDEEPANPDVTRRGNDAQSDTTKLDTEMEFESCIEKVVIHPNYDADTSQNDIAILIMAMEIPEQFKSHVVSVSLPTIAMEAEGYPAEGTKCTVYGWGFSHAAVTIEEWVQDDFVEPVAKKLDIEVRSDAVCSRFHEFIFQYSSAYNNDSTFCAGNIGDDYGGAFRGDSGGPVICGYADKYYQAGVVSYGSYTLGAYIPGFFTRVTTYEEWINNVTAQYT